MRKMQTEVGRSKPKVEGSNRVGMMMDHNLGGKVTITEEANEVNSESDQSRLSEFKYI